MSWVLRWGALLVAAVAAIGVVGSAPSARASSDGTLYFAEGSTRPGFQEYLTLQNAGDTAKASITYVFADGTPAKHQIVEIKARSRATVDVNQLVGSGKDVAVEIDTGGNPDIIAERPMYFNLCFTFCFSGSHIGVAVSPRTSWDFAEGYTGPGFREFLALLNPAPRPVTVTLQHFSDAGEGEWQTLMAPNSRQTVDVNQLVGPGREVSIHLSAPSGVVAERTMYFNACLGKVCMDGGDVVAGSEPGTDWNFAEGYTGPGFQEYLVLRNPRGRTAKTRITYMFDDGGHQTQELTLPARGRTVVDVNKVLGAAHQVSAAVTAETPVLAERIVYFAGNFPVYDTGGTAGVGLRPATRWRLAEGYTGAGFSEYILIQNPGPTVVQTGLTLFDDKGQTTTWAGRVPGQTRVTLAVNKLAGPGRAVSATLSSSGPVVAERAIYSNGCLGATPVCFNQILQPKAPDPGPPTIKAGRSILKIPILMYHYIRVNPNPGDSLGYSLSVMPADFRAQMRWLADHDYHPVDLADVRAYLTGKGNLPVRPVVVTLDDGYTDLYTEAYPVLKQRHFKAVAYIVAGFLGSHQNVSRSQVVEMDHNGIEIAAHTLSHPDLTHISSAQVTHEVTDSKKDLEQLLGHPVLDFAYPYGAYSGREIQAVIDAGFQSATTTNPGTAHSLSDRYTWTRVRVSGGTGLSAFVQSLGQPET